MTKRKQHKLEFEARVALEALNGDHPTMTHQWEMELLKGAVGLFRRGRETSDQKADAARIKDLYTKIGNLTAERDFL